MIFRKFRRGVALAILALAVPASAQTLPVNALVFFNYNGAAITSAGQSTIQSIARVHSKKPNSKVRIIGILNSSGQEVSRRQIAMRRADAVKNRLVSLGVPVGAITISLEPPRLPTLAAPGQPRPAQRRVEVHIE